MFRIVVQSWCLNSVSRGMRFARVGLLASLSYGCGPAVGSQSSSEEGSSTNPASGESSVDSVSATSSPPTTGSTSQSDDDSTAGDSGGGASHDASDTSGSREPGWIDEARSRYPTFRALYDDYLVRSCTPFENVCHDNHESPTLREADDYLDAFGAPCRTGYGMSHPFDRCEPVGHDMMVLGGPSNGWRSEIGWRDVEVSNGQVQLSLRDEVPAAAGSFTISIETGHFNRPWIDVEGATIDGSFVVAPLTDLTEFQLDLLQTTVIEGDPNRNGVFGADDPVDLLRPGAPQDSYMFLGMAEAVVGVEMPLANTAAEPAEVGALGCWIQQVASPDATDLDAPIDYDNCTVELP